MLPYQAKNFATASEQQSAVSEEVNHFVEQVATISAETSQAMKQASRAATDMARQSETIQQLLQK